MDKNIKHQLYAANELNNSKKKKKVLKELLRDLWNTLTDAQMHLGMNALCIMDSGLPL